MRARVVLALLLLTAPAPGLAQQSGDDRPVVRGRLLDADSGEPIVGGDVHLLRGDSVRLATAVSGDDGAFHLTVPDAGTYRVRGESLGYEPSSSAPFYLVRGDTVSIEFRLGVAAVELEPITVVASALPWGDRVGLVGMDDFFQRYARYSGGGFAEFMTRDSIATFEDRVPTTGHMLQWSSRAVRDVDPGTGEVTLRNGCAPTYYLNGSRVPYTMVQPLGPTTLEAVEVYLRPAIPAELGSGTPCGVVSYWSRQSPPDALPENRLGRTMALVAMAAGIVAVILTAIP